MKFAYLSNAKVALFCFESPAQCTSWQGGDCVILDALPAIDCSFGREARRSARTSGAWTQAPAQSCAGAVLRVVNSSLLWTV